MACRDARRVCNCKICSSKVILGKGIGEVKEPDGVGRKGEEVPWY